MKYVDETFVYIHGKSIQNNRNRIHYLDINIGNISAFSSVNI